MCASYNIFGISSEIGIEFYNLIKNKCSATGFCSSSSYNEIKDRIDCPLIEIDFSNLNWANNLSIPNHEGLLYLIGKSHFSDELFDFTMQEIKEHFFLDIISLLFLIKKSIEVDNPRLKKIVVISSIVPPSVKSIYHLTKSLQYNMLEMIIPILKEHEISISIIHSNWINTRMFQQYIKKYPKTTTIPKSPKRIAEKCLREFEFNKESFNTITLY